MSATGAAQRGSDRFMKSATLFSNRPSTNSGWRWPQPELDLLADEQVLVVEHLPIDRSNDRFQCASAFSSPAVPASASRDEQRSIDSDGKNARG
jgi:hypothetical protein